MWVALVSFLENTFLLALQKNDNKSYISEPLIESVPQIHILLCLWAQNPKLITGQQYFGFAGIDPFFCATLVTSIISAAKGIVSFLLEGPCKLVPKKGLFGGLGTMGFIFLCLNITSILIGKGLMLASSYYLGIGRNFRKTKVNAANVSKIPQFRTHIAILHNFFQDYTVVIYWACFNILPQFILVSF